MKILRFHIGAFVGVVALLSQVVSCNVDEVVPPIATSGPVDTFKTTPYVITYPKWNSAIWLRLHIPADNPLTVEGIALGKKLFFEKRLSVDNTISCASCHAPNHAFSDQVALSLGVDAKLGSRNAMPLFNLAWADVLLGGVHKYFWDGRKATLEDQVLGPIADPNEMANTYAKVVADLRAMPEYTPLFRRAFGTDSITITRVIQAIAQFERILISSNSKFDKYKRGEVTLSDSELRGLTIFNTEKGDCFHCHGSENNPLFTDFKFRNNGLDSIPTDLGLGALTANPADYGLFKTPSLRNLSFTAPYMHDGRFQTLEEVIEFYNSGTKDGATTDEVIRKHFPHGGLNLSQQDKQDLINFLRTLDDYEFINNPEFRP